MPAKDLFLLGANFSCITSAAHEYLQKTAKVIADHHCTEANSDYISNVIMYHLQKRASIDPYWISLNADVLKPAEFKSNSRDAAASDDGVSLGFVREFLRRFSGQAAGLDLSEVNFNSYDSPQNETDQ